ncbi:MAG: glutathione S-transferase family protein [Rhodospirillaceae bacterium]|nr:glutathione S-transferase family protein [Rhodospirillaceae bacterium]
MTITLHQFLPLYGLPNASPFCVKLETYLRMAGLPYEVSQINGPPKSATGKAPYITIDGQTICDSGLVILHLEQKYGHPVDGKLTLEQRAQSLAFQRLMEEHLYWAMVFARWTDPAKPAETLGYVQQVIGLKGLLGFIVPRILKRSVKKALWNHGLGRHSTEDIWRLGIADVQALSHWLGMRPYGFGDQPTVFDAVLFSQIACILHTPWDFPLKAATLKHRNLVEHSERILARYFPELNTPRI